jgi:hypothetical protein
MGNCFCLGLRLQGKNLNKRRSDPGVEAKATLQIFITGLATTQQARSPHHIIPVFVSYDLLHGPPTVAVGSRPALSSSGPVRQFSFWLSAPQRGNKIVCVQILHKRLFRQLQAQTDNHRQLALLPDESGKVYASKDKAFEPHEGGKRDVGV